MCRYRYRHDKISAISGISVSPERKRLGLYCLLYSGNIGQAEVCEFLRHLLKHLRGRVIVLWDSSPVHKGQPIRALCHGFPRLHLEAFPAYAPELNPDEGVWGHLKRSLSNGRPDDLEELIDHLTEEVQRVSTSQPILRGCIRLSRLPLFLP